MARSVTARQELFALRREIARIEGRLAERLEMPCREDGADRPDTSLLATGVARLDNMLGGGLPRAALTEIHGVQTRDAGLAAGFTLALATLALKESDTPRPLLWIAAGEAFSEAGHPYAPGILHRFGIAPDAMVFACTRRLEDALWVAEEAAALTAFSTVLLEVRGPSAKLDLTATRRLHHRTQATARPLFLLRQMGRPEPTAAPVRFLVAPAPAGERDILSGALAGSIGPPAFTVAISGRRAKAPVTLVLEWNRDERSFHERHAFHRRSQDSGTLVSLSADRTHSEGEAGAVMAFRRSA